MVGPLFECEAVAALMGRTLAGVCRWANEMTVLERRNVYSDSNKRQVDLFCYCTGDTGAPCAEDAEACVRVVPPPDGAEYAFQRAVAAVDVRDDASFSPPDRRGPQKYFVGEVYSGEQKRADKVTQLESALDFLVRRFTDRTGRSSSSLSSPLTSMQQYSKIKKQGAG